MTGKVTFELMKILLAVAVVILSTAVFAHDAPTGWTYGWECCSGVDCQQAADADVQETKDGYLMTITGELVAYDDKRIKKSKDEFFHECTVGGDKKARLICLYVPNRAF